MQWTKFACLKAMSSLTRERKRLIQKVIILFGWVLILSALERQKAGAGNR